MPAILNLRDERTLIPLSSLSLEPGTANVTTLSAATAVAATKRAREESVKRILNMGKVMYIDL